MTKIAVLATLIVGVAAYLRLPALADRPMHADEAIYAYKLGTLLETGEWRYDPGEYHGPLLHYLTAATSYVAGARSHADLTEPMLRIIPSVLGVLLVLSPLLVSGGLGRLGAIAAAALLAISPAMVYYSRYYIPEILLVTLTAALLAAGYRYSRAPGPGWALAAGALFGLMMGTKETALIAAVAAVCGVLAAGVRRINVKHGAIAAGAAVAVTVALLGSRESAASLLTYMQRGINEQRHIHPWHYYLNLALWWRESGGPVWTEGLIVALAAAGGVASFRQRAPGQGDPRLLRFLTAYTIIMAAIYSAIPYKTPWCLLGFLHGLILLAGAGAGFLTTIASGWSRGVIAVALGLGAGYTAWEAHVGSRQYSADPRNPYVYAHTSREVYAIRQRVAEVAELHEEGRQMRIQVISPENIWPLPWYLRSFPHVEWRRAVSGEMRPAGLILATPGMENALLHHLYEVMPAGKRPLYVSLFSDYTELRPGLEIRGYVQQSIVAAR
jgi:predicted membrane-bound mannosyltransferase